MKEKLYGEYKTRGEYHKYLDPNWAGYKLYMQKMQIIRDYLDKQSKRIKILDLGCGEGVLVEEYKNRKYDILGLDLNYESNYVIRGDATDTQFPDNLFDLVLCLDVIEHLYPEQQDKLIKEIDRILKPNGKIIFSIPNLANFVSRIRFLIRGELHRTSSIYRHKGDRPIREYLDLLREKFKIERRIGLINFRKYTLLNKTIRTFPDLCMVNIIFLKKEINQG